MAGRKISVPHFSSFLLLVEKATARHFVQSLTKNSYSYDYQDYSKAIVRGSSGGAKVCAATLQVWSLVTVSFRMSFLRDKDCRVFPTPV